MLWVCAGVWVWVRGGKQGRGEGGDGAVLGVGGVRERIIMGQILLHSPIHNNGILTKIPVVKDNFNQNLNV